MTKQEEIREDAIIITKDQLWREGIRDEQRLSMASILIVDGVFSRLNDKDVVIKAKAPLNNTIKIIDGGVEISGPYQWAAVEPLVK